ncbi:MAG: hypothetical protein ACRDNO_14815, partial [Trebonia sp.]
VEAMTMGDRIAVLNAGVLQQYGPPEELYARPVNLFVARFIGSPEMNLYEAAVDESGTLVLGSQRVSLGPLASASAARTPGDPGTPGNPVTPGRPVVVGVRPEDLTPCPDGSAGALTVDVRAVERLGSELHAYFSIDAQSLSTVPLSTVPLSTVPLSTGPLNTGPLDTGLLSAGPRADADADAGLPGTAHNGVARLDPRVAVRPGGRLTLRVDPGRLYFFDPATGQATGWPASQGALPRSVSPGTAPALPYRPPPPYRPTVPDLSFCHRVAPPARLRWCPRWWSLGRSWPAGTGLTGASASAAWARSGRPVT